MSSNDQLAIDLRTVDLKSMDRSVNPTGTHAGTFIPPTAFAEVLKLMNTAVEDQAFPGAVLLIGSNHEKLVERAFGLKMYDQEGDGSASAMTVDTVFDVAALTNIMITTTLVMKLVDTGVLALEDRVARYVQGFSVLGKSGITVGQLLSHTSGLSHWHPFFEELLRENAGSRPGVMTSRGAREYIYNEISRSALKYEPGSKQLYSDLGFIMLGHLIETLTGVGLDRAAQRFVFQPLGLKSTSYVDLTLIKRRGIHPVRDLIAPTELCPWRKRVLCGEVHDDNAWAMGGIAGHSGLFSTANDLHSFAAEMTRAYHGESDFLPAEIVRTFWTRQSRSTATGFAFGWDTPSKENELLETGLTAQAVGHNGFTGCSLWIEPERRLHIALLSNRVHPSRSNKKIRTLRPLLIDAIIKVAAS